MDRIGKPSYPICYSVFLSPERPSIVSRIEVVDEDDDDRCRNFGRGTSRRRLGLRPRAADSGDKCERLFDNEELVDNGGGGVREGCVESPPDEEEFDSVGVRRPPRG